MPAHIEIISKQGKVTKYYNLSTVLDILADVKQIQEMQIHVISIVEKDANDGTKECADWYLKTIDDKWYPESEARLKSLSSEYRNMVDNHVSCDIPDIILDSMVWVLRNYKTDTMQGLDYKLHITRDVDIHQYRRLFECNSIQRVISYGDMMGILLETR